MNKEKVTKILSQYLNTIPETDIKEFAYKLIDVIPEYIWEVPASSTGKYHPAYTIGQNGLFKHMIATFRLFNNFVSLSSFKNQFTDRQISLLKIAAIFHDGMKSGTQAEYEKSKYTKFNHPLLMAELVKTVDGLPDDEKNYIAEAISSHMGEWNVSKRESVVLPTPTTLPQLLVHLSDYFASRKEITVDVESGFKDDETSISGIIEDCQKTN